MHKYKTACIKMPKHDYLCILKVLKTFIGQAKCDI